MAAPRHVLLHEAHGGFGFDVEPPGVEGHALAHQRHARRVGRAPSEVDEARRLVRGLPDGVDQRELPRQRLAADRARAGPMAPRHIERRGLERVGPEVVGRRVHEIAGERQAARDALDLRDVDAGGRHEARRLGRRRLVPGEPIGRREPGESREVGARRQRRGEAIGSGRQGDGELAGHERIVEPSGRRLHAEQHGREPAIRTRQEDLLRGPCLEPHGVSETDLRVRQAAGPVFAGALSGRLPRPVVSRDAMDRDRVGRGFGEQRHRQGSALAGPGRRNRARRAPRERPLRSD